MFVLSIVMSIALLVPIKTAPNFGRPNRRRTIGASSMAVGTDITTRESRLSSRSFVLIAIGVIQSS